MCPRFNLKSMKLKEKSIPYSSFLIPANLPWLLLHFSPISGLCRTNELIPTAAHAGLRMACSAPSWASQLTRASQNVPLETDLFPERIEERSIAAGEHSMSDEDSYLMEMEDDGSMEGEDDTYMEGEDEGQQPGRME
jgi:hypothetical protein